MTYKTILFSVNKSVATITINRPKALNALNMTTLEELKGAIKEVKETPDLKILIITGTGNKAFVAGADISQMVSFSPSEGMEFSALGHSVLRDLEMLPIPVIAAVNGYALGGGTELLLACDIAYASTNARFGQPEVKLGIIPGFGGTQRLPRLVGPMMAKELIFTGRIIDPQEALRIGLITKVCELEELMKSVDDLAQEIIKNGPNSISVAKRLIQDGAHLSLPDANDLEKNSFSQLFDSQEPKEGMTAFLEMRAANFDEK